MGNMAVCRLELGALMELGEEARSGARHTHVALTCPMGQPMRFQSQLLVDEVLPSSWHLIVLLGEGRVQTKGKGFQSSHVHPRLTALSNPRGILQE